MTRILISFTVVLIGVFSCRAEKGYDDIAQLVKAGMDDSVTIAFINASNASYNLTSDNILELKKMGASDKVITAAIQHQKLNNDSAPQKTDTAMAPQQATAKSQQPTVNSPSGNSSTTVVYVSRPHPPWRLILFFQWLFFWTLFRHHYR